MRSYERPLFVLIALLAVSLVLAIFRPGLLLIETSETPVAGGPDRQASANPVPNPDENPGPDASLDSQGGGTGPPVPSEGPPYDRTAANKDRPSDQLLCSAPERLSTLAGNGLAVAADPDGHYTLYALPDPQTGRPTNDSYELLRGCLPKSLFANTTAVRTAPKDRESSASPVEETGASNLNHPTRHITSDTGSQLVTTYDLTGGLRLTQRLGLQSGKLRVVYELTNRSDKPATATLRSLLSPTPATPGQEVRFELPNGGSENGIEHDPVIRNEGSRDIGSVWAPRLAAASDSTARWRTTAGPRPTKLAFAGFHRLNSGSFHYDAQDRYPLPPNASIAIYWEGLSLKPGETVTVAQTYGPETSQDPGR